MFKYILNILGTNEKYSLKKFVRDLVKLITIEHNNYFSEQHWHIYILYLFEYVSIYMYISLGHFN